MNSEMIGRLNDQMGLEFTSGYLYLGFAARLESLALPGAAHWYKVQAEEELAHGMRIFDHLVLRGAEPELSTLSAPQDIPESFEEIAEAGYRHERYITESIEDLLFRTSEEGDPATAQFLQWFVTEQTEEERNARGIIDALSRTEGCSAALMLLDERMGGREK